jgi:hypothetical protein
MIGKPEKSEIDVKADGLGVHAAYVRRDYVFGWLPAGLAQRSPMDGRGDRRPSVCKFFLAKIF